MIARKPNIAMEFAYINREILRWARTRSGLTKHALAAKLRVSPQQIEDWENGPGYPPFSRAETLASTLAIPFGYLFLSRPPDEKPALPDLRTIAPSDRAPSPEFIDVLNDTVVRHDWYLEYARENGSEDLPFVGRRSIGITATQTAADIRSVIDVNELRYKAKNPSDYVRLLTEAAEDVGILVMRAGVVRGNPHRKLSVSEFRGFVISNAVAPLVFVNSKDAPSAQVFTIAHELAHIWVGESGISNPELRKSHAIKDRRDRLEEYCNQTAAELLVPESEFKERWKKAGGNNQAKSETVAKNFKVSVSVILRRALECSYMSHDEFASLWKIHQEKIRAFLLENQEESSGGSFYNTFFARNSYRFAHAVVTFTSAGRIGTLEASRLLHVHTGTLPKIARRLSA